MLERSTGKSSSLIWIFFVRKVSESTVAAANLCNHFALTIFVNQKICQNNFLMIYRGEVLWKAAQLTGIFFSFKFEKTQQLLKISVIIFFLQTWLTRTFSKTNFYFFYCRVFCYADHINLFDALFLLVIQFSNWLKLSKFGLIGLRKSSANYSFFIIIIICLFFVFWNINTVLT